MKNLQLLELNTVALKHKGLHQLKTKVNKFQNEKFPASFLIVSNQTGQGYFKINFPKIEISFQEYQYVQNIQLSPMKFYELVGEIVSKINVDFIMLKQKLLQQTENQQKNEVKNFDQIQLFQQNVLVTKPAIPNLAIIISESKDISKFRKKVNFLIKFYLGE